MSSPSNVSGIYSMELHERYTINSFTSAMRVAGGWIYETRDNRGKEHHTFVPFDNEFQQSSEVKP